MLETLIPRLSVAALEVPRAHLLQRDPRCDTVVVLNMAARRRPGRRLADMNAVAGLQSDYNLHWPEGPWLNHFTHRHTGGYRRGRFGRKIEILEPIPAHLHHKPVGQTPDAEIRTWRKNIGSPRRPKWVRPFTVAERQVQANRRLVTIAWELKSVSFGNQAIAHRMTTSLAKVGGKWFVFTLASMSGWAQKLTAFHREGVQTGLDANGARRPGNLSELHPAVIDVILGRFA